MFYSYKLIGILVLFLFLSLLFSTLSQIAKGQIKQDNSFLTYENPAHRIRIQYPSNWQISEKDIFPYDDTTTIVDFIKDPNSFSGDMLISVYNLTADTRALSIPKLLDNIISSYNKYYYNDFKLMDVNTTNITVAGNPAYKLVWTDRIAWPDILGKRYIIETMQVGTIIGNRLYLLQYYAGLEKYSNNLPIVQRMINSFQITNSIQKH